MVLWVDGISKLHRTHNSRPSTLTDHTKKDQEAVLEEIPECITHITLYMESLSNRLSCYLARNCGHSREVAFEEREK